MKRGMKGFIIALVLGLLPLWTQTTVSAADWYNPGWLYRTPVTINNTGSALANYQVKINVTYDSDMKSDFSDLRFTDSDGTTLLNYWVESYTASTSAVAWVNVPSIPASSTKTIYMYYDNPSAGSASNGANTFNLFDDFSDGDYSDNPTWTRWTGGGNWDASSGYLVSSGSGDWDIHTPSTYAQNSAWEFKVRALAGTGGSGSQAGAGLVIISNNVDANADVNANSVTAGINGSNVFLSYGTTPTSIVTAAWTKDTAWHAIKVTRNSANLWELFLDGVSKGTGTYTGLTTSSYLQAYERSKANGWDDIRVRKYASPEPGASIGTEESPPTPTPTITPTPTPTITPTKGMDAPGLPTAGSGMYTLQQIYDYMTSGTTLTVESSFQEPTSGPRPTMKSLKQLGDAVKSLYEQCDVTAANVDSGKKFFSTVPGSWGVQTGTR